MQIRRRSRTIIIASSAAVTVIVTTLFIIQGLFDGTIPFGRAEITAKAFSESDLLNDPHTPPDYLSTALTVDSKTLDQIPQLKEVLLQAFNAKNNAVTGGESPAAYVKVSMPELNSIKGTLNGARMSPDFIVKDKDPDSGKIVLMHVSGTLVKYNDIYYFVRFVKLFPF